jgi:hypothetical protein
MWICKAIASLATFETTVDWNLKAFSFRAPPLKLPSTPQTLRSQILEDDADDA